MEGGVKRGAIARSFVFVDSARRLSRKISMITFGDLFNYHFVRTNYVRSGTCFVREDYRNGVVGFIGVRFKENFFFLLNNDLLLIRRCVFIRHCVCGNDVSTKGRNFHDFIAKLAGCFSVRFFHGVFLWEGAGSFFYGGLFALFRHFQDAISRRLRLVD